MGSVDIDEVSLRPTDEFGVEVVNSAGTCQYVYLGGDYFVAGEINFHLIQIIGAMHRGNLEDKAQKESNKSGKWG